MPQLQFIAEVVNIYAPAQKQISMDRTIENTVGIPQVQYIDKVVDVLVARVVRAPQLHVAETGGVGGGSGKTEDGGAYRRSATMLNGTLFGWHESSQRESVGVSVTSAVDNCAVYWSELYMQIDRKAVRPRDRETNTCPCIAQSGRHNRHMKTGVQTNKMTCSCWRRTDNGVIIVDLKCVAQICPHHGEHRHRMPHCHFLT